MDIRGSLLLPLPLGSPLSPLQRGEGYTSLPYAPPGLPATLNDARHARRMRTQFTDPWRMHVSKLIACSTSV